MRKWLLAAEADQIQDFIFRSSRLREVVGGSQLLSRFCRLAPELLLKQEDYKGNPDEDVIVNDGGAFLIKFDDEEDGKKARRFGSDLSEFYRRCTGSNLTIAEPAEYNEDFRDANREAQRKLRLAKSHGDVSATAVHLPYLAFCVSCGTAIADSRHKRDEEENYYCSLCLLKEEERNEDLKNIREKRENSEDSDESGFLGRFHKAVYEVFTQKILEGKLGGFPYDADDVAAFDLTGRRYVAYLLADGNGMGGIFSACPDESTLKKLSKGLPGIVRESLASPFPLLFKRIEKQNKKNIIPVMPLILGGDDLFALLPASWAIDYAALFCREYEEKMKKLLDELKILREDRPPTISAAVVICKSSYPYTLAHRRGEGLLNEAKQFARGLETDIDNRQFVSVVNFAVITGNEVGSAVRLEQSDYRPTARPYYVNKKLTDSMKKAGLSIQSLCDMKLEIARSNLSSKRRAELEKLYDELIFSTDINNTEEVERKWKPRFDALLNRLKRVDENGFKTVVETLEKLGDKEKKDIGYWRYFKRLKSEGFRGHGLGDLLTAWDYAYDLSKDLSEYGE